jgi:hypothetical protein
MSKQPRSGAIPLTADAREGLARMVAVADCGSNNGARADAEAVKARDPKMTAAMAWIECLPDGPIETWPVRLDGNCAGCPLGNHDGNHLCQLSWVLDGEERPCDYEAVPQWCRHRFGSVLVMGVMP